MQEGKSCALLCGSRLTHSAAQDSITSGFFGVFFISLIKGKPLSLLDAFVIASSLASAYTAGFKCNLKCREFKH